MKKYMMYLIYGLRRFKIFWRLLVMCILATLLPVLIFSIWSYRKNSEVIREKVYDSVNAVLDQLSGEVNQMIERIRNDSIEISYMEEIQDAILNYDDYNSRELNKIKINITKEMSRKYAFDNVVAGITLYTFEHKKINVYGEDVLTINLSDEYLDEFLKICYEQDGRSVFQAVNETHQMSKVKLNREAIIVGKAVKRSKTGEMIGFMVMQINEESFSDIYGDINQKMNAQTFILDEAGTVISTAGDYASVGALYPDEEILEHLLLLEAETEEQKVDGSGMVCLSRRMEQNDWQLFFLIPESYLQTGLSDALLSFAVIGVSCIFLGIVVTFLFSCSIIFPLNQVVEGLEQFEKGNLSVVLDEAGADEITELSTQFNRMAKEINSLLERVKGDEKQKRKLEIQALQAQINPHFLANTLNTVSYIARMKQEETIEILTNAIIELLRNSMKNDDSLHSVEEEAELIRNYITIQDYRLLGKFTVDMQIEPNILNCMVPRFILQPVVENAIIHGVEPLNRRGQISIRGYRRENEVIFQITDNGAGMEKEKIQHILQEQRNIEKSRFNGVGIGNVDKRIHLLFGEEYGLSIKSEKNVFTSVRMNLPVIGKELEG